ncbi:MAG: hypothetical protein WAN05_16265, partial [Roseiarcus sp.]
PTVTNVATAARPAPKPPASAPPSDGAPKYSASGRPPADEANGEPKVKPALKVDDPFADIDSLEAEMSRLLGREKPN